MSKLSLILLSYYSAERIVNTYEKIRHLLNEMDIPFVRETTQKTSNPASDDGEGEYI